MQSAVAAFTAESRDSVRKIAQNTQVSWHRDYRPSNRTFTIGISTIGGNDVIGANPGALGSPANYRYFDESQYVTSLGWERGLNMPTGGLAKAMAEARLDNTSGRFLPRYMGGNSEIYTAILPSRPVVFGAGFNIDGVDLTLQQFTGVLREQPMINVRNREVSLRASDYIDFFQNKYLDQTAMFTGLRTDEVFTNIATDLGMTTAQYDFDYGINTIPFGVFAAGTRVSDIFHKLAEAENGHFYQDESGIFKFENRQHWDSSPWNTVQKVIYTAQVLNAEAPNVDHLINVVEVKSTQRSKQPLQVIMNFNTPTMITANSTKEMFFSYDDPVLEVTAPTVGGSDSYYLANTRTDFSGTNVTSSVSVKSISNFAEASKIVFQNNSSVDVWLNTVVISGRPAKKIGEIYYREQRDGSVTAYQERRLLIDNDFIGSQDWAQSYAQMILQDYSQIENLQRITIRAIPELQLGDLISWQGRYWRIFDIKASLNPSEGFIQELTLLQRTITTYFRIGISTIGGSDKIAP